VETALRIIEDDRIRQALVFDESALNDRRILVTWVSPNTWAYGYRYGNVMFSFDFSQVIEGRRFYWVESIDKYSPPACRILITDQDRSSLLEPYNPSSAEGPWWHDVVGDKHYRNNDYTLEFMIEGDLPMAAVREVTFVKHHSDYCSIHRNSPKSCRQLGMGESRGGAAFLRAAASKGLSLAAIRDRLYANSPKANPDDLPWGLHAALASVLPRKFDTLKHVGSVSGASDMGLALARAVLNGLAALKTEEAKDLAAQFRSDREMYAGVASVIAETLNFADSARIARAIDGQDE
jgi:hypothetical protein